jgi:eukaryotic-like serine/threonine-protein kinase
MSQTTVRARYQVISRIASGGMGEVYRARDSELQREVAIKVLHRNLAGDPGFIDRFRREARAAALLSHPNIVAVHDWGSTATGTYYMVMEFVRGRTLRELLSAHGRLEPAHAVEVLIQMLAALDHAHRHGIVHRDVKPENVLITPEGVAKVADFGLARAFAESRISQAPGTVTGTVQYLAPEQIQGDPADPRTDLYAIGILAFELLTGHVPFAGETSLAVAYKHLTDRVPPPSVSAPDVPERLDRVVRWATEKGRDDRPPSAAHLRRELIAAAGSAHGGSSLAELVRDTPAGAASVEGRASTVTFPRALPPAARRRRVVRRVWAAVLAVLVVAGLAWAAWAYVVPHYTSVPGVIGLEGPQARARVEAAGLDAQFGLPEPSTAIPEGHVVRQSVEGDARVRTGTEVVLTLSAGLPLRPVPDVRGRAEADALDALEGAGLDARIEHAYSDDVPAGRVIDQNPSPGQRIQFGSPVTVTISRGAEPVEVPSVVGSDADQARSLLEAAEFTVRIEEEHSDTVPEGLVARQEPPEGAAPRGTEVTIWVSLGPKPFPMPDVRGLALDEARPQLEGLGLDVLVRRVPGSVGNNVAGQIPDPGATVERGDDVRIFVA